METGNSKYDSEHSPTVGDSFDELTSSSKLEVEESSKFDVEGSSKSSIDGAVPKYNEPSVDSEVGSEDQLSAWEKSAKAIAEKVQRQQEGLETAMLEPKHEDETFLTVDEIAALLEAQMAENTSSKKRKQNSQAERDTLADWFCERSKFIPLRLSYEERKWLRLVKATMRGAEYTDIIDGKIFKSEVRRNNEIVRCLGATLTGLVTAINHQEGQRLAEERNFSVYRKDIQTVFEITRRYKIMNPEKVRNEYGKLLYMLQDSALKQIRDTMGMTCVKPIKNVWDFLNSRGGLEVLRAGIFQQQ